MAANVFLRLLKDNSLELFRADDEALIVSSMPNGLEQIMEACRGKRLIVLIPTSDVHLSTQKIPARNRQKILQAIPYAIEDNLIGDVQSFHFAIPAKLGGDETPVCVIARERLEAILDRLNELRLHPQVIIPEILLADVDESEWNVLVDAHEAAIQTDPYHATGVDTDNLEACLAMALKQEDEQAPEQINLIDARPQPHAPLQLESDMTHIAPQTLDSGLLPWLAAHYRDDAGINLLQGEFAPRKMATQSYRKWYPALTLFIIVLLIQGATAIIHYSHSSKESIQLQAQIEKGFKKALPEAKRMQNIQARMTQKLTNLKRSSQGAGAGFLPILEKFSKSMQGYKSINLKGMNFRNGRLNIEMTIGDIQALEKLKQSLIQTGLQVDIRSATVQGNSVFARLRIQETV